MATDKYGFNKAARLRAKREEAEAQQIKEYGTLDAEFPFEMVGFEPSFFRAELSLPEED